MCSQFTCFTWISIYSRSSNNVRRKSGMRSQLSWADSRADTVTDGLRTAGKIIAVRKTYSQKKKHLIYASPRGQWMNTKERWVMTSRADASKLVERNAMAQLSKARLADNTSEHGRLRLKQITDANSMAWFLSSGSDQQGQDAILSKPCRHPCLYCRNTQLASDSNSSKLCMTK